MDDAILDTREVSDLFALASVAEEKGMFKILEYTAGTAMRNNQFKIEMDGEVFTAKGRLPISYNTLKESVKKSYMEHLKIKLGQAESTVGWYKRRIREAGLNFKLD